MYGAGQVLADGVVPRRIIATSAHFLRQAAGINPPNGVRIHVAGVDLIRDEQGTFRVLEDNVRIPSGVSYVMENRRAMAQVLPEVFAATRILPVEAYPSDAAAGAARGRADGVGDPTVVVLSPGVYNSAYFEHALLAREMGVELVEGRDLVCVGNDVAMRTTAGEQRVDVIYRRIDDDFLDPVHFRADSVIGVAGLLNAARAGRVTIANAVGNGVADDKLLYTYVPDLIRYYLNEEPLLPNVDTYRLDEPGVLDDVLPRLDRAGDQAGGRRRRRGHRDRLAGHRAGAGRRPGGDPGRPARLDRPARGEAVDGADADRQPAARPARGPAAVRGQRRRQDLGAARRPDPGGAARGRLVVNSSQGGGSKDTWVLADPADTAPFEEPHLPVDPDAAARPPPAPISGPGADVNESQQQQQQQGRSSC